MYSAQGNRTVSAIASGAIVAGIGAMLLFGLQAGVVVKAAQSLVALNIIPPTPTPTPSPTRPPPQTTKAAPKGDPGQHNLKNKATQIVLPKPPIVIVPPPPVAVATTAANTGNAVQSGASDRAGPGQGAGNYGNGLGGGGTGGDGDGDAVVGPQKIRGRLSFDDLPEDALMPGQTARVVVRYAVETDGSATGCRAARSSGFPRIDALACRLIERRYYFRPARNAAGRPVRAIVEENHTWVLDEDMRPPR